MNNKFLALCASMAVVAGFAVSCDPANTDEPENGPKLEAGFGVYIQQDGSIILEGETGADNEAEDTDNYTGVNRLFQAISAYADQKVLPTEGTDSVMCNNVFYLQNGESYYCQGKCSIKKPVTISAYKQEGAMPVIMQLSDASGAVQADMIRIEKDVTFNYIYIYGRNEKDKNMERIIRTDGKDITVTLNKCFADYAALIFFRINAANNSVYMNDCTVRNLYQSSSSNGRFIDTRGNATNVISIKNSLVYNTWGHIIRDDNCVINEIVLDHNTFNTVGTRFSIVNPRKITITNNIFGNVAWRNAAWAKANEVPNGSFFNLDSLKTEAALAAAEIVITNNNVYNDAELETLYKNSAMSLKPEGLSLGAQYNQQMGKLKYENNICEVLTYTNPAPIHWQMISKYFEGVDGAAPSDDVLAEEPWAVDEDEKPGIVVGKTYSYKYAKTFKSATASTTKGPLGAEI